MAAFLYKKQKRSEKWTTHCVLSSEAISAYKRKEKTVFQLDDIRREFARLDAITSIDTSHIPIVISTQAKLQRGCCVYAKRGVKAVRFSAFIFNDQAEDFFNTVRHEYAHALVKLRYPKEQHGHDAVWKRACMEIGCPPTRCSQIPQERDGHPQNYKYCLSCDTCHAKWNYFRSTERIRAIQNGEQRYICPFCGGRLFSVQRFR